jgi:hypothetical protein
MPKTAGEPEEHCGDVITIEAAGNLSGVRFRKQRDQLGALLA